MPDDPGAALRSGAALRRVSVEVVAALGSCGLLASGAAGAAAAVVFRVLADEMFGPAAVELEPPARPESV